MANAASMGVVHVRLFSAVSLFVSACFSANEEQKHPPRMNRVHNVLNIFLKAALYAASFPPSCCSHVEMESSRAQLALAHSGFAKFALVL